MSKLKSMVVAAVAAATVGIGFGMWGIGTAAGQPVTTTGTLSAAEQAGVTFSREEERMAREIYTLFADKYDTGPFAMISSSEQRHFDAVGVLLTKYGVSDPSAGAKPGVYADASLQKLYDGWKASGLTSVTAADQVGVALENQDIADLDRLRAGTTNVDLDRVYNRLANGSASHLAAYTAAANGTTPLQMGTGAQRHAQNGDTAGVAGMGAGPGAGTGTGTGTGAGPGTGPGAGTGSGRSQGAGTPGEGCVGM